MARAQLERVNCHVFPSWFDALEHCGGELFAPAASPFVSTRPKRPMIFVNVNLLGGRPFRSNRFGWLKSPPAQSLADCAAHRRSCAPSGLNLRQSLAGKRQPARRGRIRPAELADEQGRQPLGSSNVI
jgi:hypothetical protein